jgi:RHS repeat-associated protein
LTASAPATSWQLKEKPHLGLGLRRIASPPAYGLCNSNTTLGISASLPRFCGGTRSTGKERDGETGLDYFGARYFSGAQGRFTSPDEPFADQDVANPQSWNLYSYVRNNPLRAIDPTGRCSEAAGGGYTDEGIGLFPGKCSEGQIGGTTPQQVTVGVGQEEANLIMLQMVGENLSSSHQWAEVVSNGGQGAMMAMSLRSLPSAARGSVNLFELWRATRLVPGSLEALAAAGGPTIEVVTSQTQALSATRGLSTAIGEGAAGVARSFQPAGTLYKANIPQTLVRALQSRGWAEVRSLPQGKELYFSPEAMQYVLKFFK